MVTDEELKRINELANKAKTTELTIEEKTEQKDLRNKYLSSIKNSFTNQISTLKVVDPDGNDVTPDKIKELKNNKNKH